MGLQTRDKEGARRKAKKRAGEREWEEGFFAVFFFLVLPRSEARIMSKQSRSMQVCVCVCAHIYK